MHVDKVSYEPKTCHLITHIISNCTGPIRNRYPSIEMCNKLLCRKFTLEIMYSTLGKTLFAICLKYTKDRPEELLSRCMYHGVLDGNNETASGWKLLTSFELVCVAMQVHSFPKCGKHYSGIL